MTRKHFALMTAISFAFAAPALAQRGRPGGAPGGPPAERGASNSSNASGSGMGNSMSRSDMSHAAPNDVLSHNTVIAGKIKTLTGESAESACSGFKNLGQCVAAAHVAKNLDIPGGFDALKAKVTGSNSMSLGKAVETLAPNANSKSEVKKANKQASSDMNDARSSS